MALDTTVGGANSDSYISVTDADTYFTTRGINTAPWDDYAGDYDQLLRRACILLDQQDFVGDPVTDTQALKWPRWYEDTQELIGNYATTVIPTPIKYAQCEIALWLADTGGTVAAGTVSELQIGTSVKAKFATGTEATVDRSVDSSGLPMEAAGFLKGLRLYSVLA